MFALYVERRDEITCLIIKAEFLICVLKQNIIKNIYSPVIAIEVYTFPFLSLTRKIGIL